jgi:hypothetical protein
MAELLWVEFVANATTMAGIDDEKVSEFLK